MQLLQAIANMGKNRIVIYGAFNRDLQSEAYAKICELAGHSDGFYPAESPRANLSKIKRIKKRDLDGVFALRDTMCRVRISRLKLPILQSKAGICSRRLFCHAAYVAIPPGSNPTRRILSFSMKTLKPVSCWRIRAGTLKSNPY